MRTNKREAPPPEKEARTAAKPSGKLTSLKIIPQYQSS
jgi:hypothetical protein